MERQRDHLHQQSNFDFAKFPAKSCMGIGAIYLSLDEHGVHKLVRQPSVKAPIFIHEHTTCFVFSAGWKKKKEIVLGCPVSRHVRDFQGQ